MPAVHMSEHEARVHMISLLNNMDVDGLALALSESYLFEDRPVVVKGAKVESYAYLNGMSGGDRRGDVYAFDGLADGE